MVRGTRGFIGGAWAGGVAAVGTFLSYWPTPYVTHRGGPQAPTEYIQQAPAPPAEDYWYYCASAGEYYPYVKDCPGGWMQVVPAPNPSGP
jgi:hypothetical protein